VSPEQFPSDITGLTQWYSSLGMVLVACTGNPPTYITDLTQQYNSLGMASACGLGTHPHTFMD